MGAWDDVVPLLNPEDKERIESFEVREKYRYRYLSFCIRNNILFHEMMGMKH